MMIHGNKLLLAYYGDDFTGSTDVMEALTSNGIPCVLFLRLPTAEDLLEFKDFRAFGIAGMSRSKTPAWMDENLPSVFEHLKQLGAPIIHYKVCSTFNSSPTVGSIGRAIDLAFDVFGPSFVPLVVGAPVLRRFTIFGNHFATVDGVTHRLDRHPTMSCHPVTSMAEADLMRHLRQQTSRSIALFDILALRSRESAALFGETLKQKADIILFDVLDESSLEEIGRLIWSNLNAPQFCVGSSGLEYSLISHWRSAGLLPRSPTVQPLGSQPNIAGPVGKLLPHDRHANFMGARSRLRWRSSRSRSASDSGNLGQRTRACALRRAPDSRRGQKRCALHRHRADRPFDHFISSNAV